MPDAEFRCERCGRLAPREMLACPDRPASGCPYALTRDRVAAPGCVGLFMLLFGVFFAGGAVFGLAASLRAGAAGSSIPALAGVTIFIGILALFGLGVALLGVYLLLGRRTTLYNAQTGATWQRYRVAGIPVAERHILRLEALAFDRLTPGFDRLTPGFEPSDFPDVPASHACLRPAFPTAKGFRGAYWDEAAFEVFQAAPVSLWARQIVAPRRAIGHSYVLGRPLQGKPGRDLLFVPGPAAGWLPIAGELERRIATAVEGWPGNPAAVTSPPGPTVYELVRAIYEKDRGTPSSWLLQLVERDATQAGLWRRAPTDEAARAGLLAKLARLMPRYEPEPGRVGELQATQRQVRAALDRLAREQPALMAGLKREFLRGMGSRTESSG